MGFFGIPSQPSCMAQDMSDEDDVFDEPDDEGEAACGHAFVHTTGRAP